MSAQTPFRPNPSRLSGALHLLTVSTLLSLQGNLSFLTDAYAETPASDTASTLTPDPTPTLTPLPIASTTPLETLRLAPDERLITILGTNDIHGGIESSRGNDGARSGGMAQLAGAVRAIREGLQRKFPQQTGTLVVDAGDQFQGTLISNINEGKLVFKLMSEVGYDAVVPGNHDYDFGPKGWLVDQVNPSTEDQDPRGALREAMKHAAFPLLSANTFLKASLREVSSSSQTQGPPVPVTNIGCLPLSPEPSPSSLSSPPPAPPQIDWTAAQNPDFLRPYIVKTVAGVRVALIGMDNPTTPRTTTASNVADLCFESIISSYLRTQARLAAQADVFVMIAHDGNTNTETTLSQAVGEILRQRPGSLHAVIAGHTHFVNDLWESGVPIIQSGANGKLFGRVDLVYSLSTQSIVASKTRKIAGLPLHPTRCPESPLQVEFCRTEAGTLLYEGSPVHADSSISALISEARTQIAPIAGRVLGKAEQVIDKDRILESPLANAMTDATRNITGTELAILNTGGLRTALPAGPITFENLYRVLPFNNRSVIIGPLNSERLLSLLRRTIQTCGAFGSLMQSGLRVRFERDCTTPVAGLDPQARLLRVETVSGEVLFDAATGAVATPLREFRVTTLDFLASGGDGFLELTTTPILADLGIARELIADHWAQTQVTLSNSIDQRWVASPRVQANPGGGPSAP
jgi:5'-nucleotidase